jgi:hypothetical protein
MTNTGDISLTQALICVPVCRYQETPIPERITSDAYIHRLLGPTHNVKQEILNISHYDEPAKRLMGKLRNLLGGNLYIVS